MSLLIVSYHTRYLHLASCILHLASCISYDTYIRYVQYDTTSRTLTCCLLLTEKHRRQIEIRLIHSFDSRHFVRNFRAQTKLSLMFSKNWVVDFYAPISHCSQCFLYLSHYVTTTKKHSASLLRPILISLGCPLVRCTKVVHTGSFFYK